MLERLIFTLTVATALNCAPPATPAAAQTRVVGYYYGPTLRNGFPIASIDGTRLTHINYAFGNIDPDGRAVLGDACLDVGRCAPGNNPHQQPGGNFAELRRLKQRYPQLRTLISIGGWSWSGRFSDVAATPERRRRFVESAVNLFIRDHAGVFDGIDLDWEYPVGGGLAGNRNRPEDRRNYTLLVSEFRRVLEQHGRRDKKAYLLTIAAPAAPSHFRNFELAALGRILDFINVMTYDYHTGGKIAHFNAPLGTAASDPAPTSNVRATVDAYVAAAVPKDKLVIGVAFYGYGYGGVAPERNGLFQSAERNGLEPGERPGPWVGAVRYRQIAEAMKSGFRRYWEPDAGVPWLYNARTRTWITYDDAESLALKADLVRDRGLGGIMIWELSGDDGTLLPTIHRRLKR
jgi:chitinase